MRSGMLLLGVGLVMLGVIGFVDRAAVWLSAGDLALGLVSLGLVLTPDTSDRYLRPTTFAFGVALAGTFAVGIATSVEPWLAWWTLSFAAGFVVLGGAYSLSQVPLTHHRVRRI